MITLRKFLNFMLPKVLSIDPLTVMGIGAGVSGLTSLFGSNKAASAQADAAEKAGRLQEEMWRTSRSDMLPFVTQATDPGTGSLSEYRVGIENAPMTPNLGTQPQYISGYTPEFAEMGDRFTGSRFSYDPNQAMLSPDIQFLQQQGEQALMRNLAGNRQLGSGSRMMDIMRFNQGLASQGLQDYFNRQRLMNEMNYGRDLGENQLAYQRGLTERDIGIQDWQREQERLLANRAAMDKLKLDQYALDRGAYEDRMSKLGGLINIGRGAGAITSQGALSTGQAMANLQQDIGDAQAAGALGRFNAIGNTLGNLSNLYMLNQSGFFDNPYNLASTLQSQPTAGSGFF